MHAGAQGFAFGASLDEYFRNIDVTADRFDDLINQTIGGVSLARRIGPIARQHQLGGYFGVDRARTEGERVSEAQDFRDRLRIEDTELTGLDHARCDITGCIGNLIVIGKICRNVIRMSRFPNSTTVQEVNIWVLFRHLEHMRVVIAPRGGNYNR
ncbi:MAG: hypothetical protein ACI845_001457 [Gammaproteobacteria bacterium]|jgi:hypothetical protein